MNTPTDVPNMLPDGASLLIRLYRHRPQRHHTPRENYVTEAFAAVLSIDDDLLRAFFQQVAKADLPKIVRIDTQVAAENGVFDIAVSGDDFYYVIESKFTAPFAVGTADQGGHQLERYAAGIAPRSEAQKGIICITLGTPPSIQLPINLFTTRWMDIIRLCQSVQTPMDSIAVFLREAFIGLLKYLNADRQIAPNGRLLWKCELCGLEMTGMGIHSHRNKHCSEYGYLIDRENEIRRKPFLERIAPYQHGIDRIVEVARRGSKIEMTNYNQSGQILDLLTQEHIPPELWLYVGNHLQFCFSNRAFSRFQDEITQRLQLQRVEPLAEPPMIWKTYENIVSLCPDELRMTGDAAQKPHEPDRLQRASPASTGR